MTTFLAIVGAWFLLSLPFGVMVGLFIGAGRPSDRGDQ